MKYLNKYFYIELYKYKDRNDMIIIHTTPFNPSIFTNFLTDIIHKNNFQIDGYIIGLHMYLKPADLYKTNYEIYEPLIENLTKYFKDNSFEEVKSYDDYHILTILNY